MASIRRYQILTIFLTMFFWKTLCSVDWRLGQDIIEIGKPLMLNCELTGIIKNVTRQWTGGENNRLICFNGVTTNPAKYKETSQSRREYTLQISDTSEYDLNYPYSCRFGFEFSEKMLSVSPKNLLAIPDQKSTRLEYLHHGYNYTIYVNFSRVYPEPECKLYKKGKFTKLNVTKTNKHRILYDVSFHTESDEPLHDCGKPVYIECSIGQMTRRYDIPHKFNCNENSTWTLAVVTVSVAAIAFLVLLLFSIKLHRRYVHHHKQLGSHHPAEIVHLDTKAAHT